MKIYSHLNSEYKEPGTLKVIHDLRQEIAELKRDPKNCLELSRMSNIDLINECKRLNGIIRGQRRKIDSMLDYEAKNNELLRYISRCNQKIKRQKEKIGVWMEKYKDLING